MVTFICPTCEQERTGVRRRCYPCTIKHTEESRAKIRASLLGVKHSEERRQSNREGQLKSGKNRFDLGAYTRGKTPPNWKPVGYERVSNGHMQVKCSDGRFRYRARLVWEAQHGIIPRGLLIHHKNEDPFDDRLENLQLVTRSEHMAIHATPDRMRAQQLLGVVVRSRKGSYARPHKKNRA